MISAISVLLDGKKVWAGLAIIFVGWLGVGEYWSPDKVGELVDLVIQLVGLFVSAYGNKVVHDQVGSLKAKLGAIEDGIVV